MFAHGGHLHPHLSPYYPPLSHVMSREGRRNIAERFCAYGWSLLRDYILRSETRERGRDVMAIYKFSNTCVCDLVLYEMFGDQSRLLREAFLKHFLLSPSSFVSNTTSIIQQASLLFYIPYLDVCLLDTRPVRTDPNHMSHHQHIPRDGVVTHVGPGRPGIPTR
jgi:hypothetical protein